MADSGLRSRLACCTAALLVATFGLTSAPATTAAEGVTTTVLTEHRVDMLAPAAQWVLRDEHSLEGDAHGHASGFLYQVEGDSVLAFEDGTGITLHAGEATWMPWMVGHLHRRPAGMRGGTDGAMASGADATATTPRLWAFLLETGTEARQPGARWVSPAFRGLGDGAHTARLAREDFAPGAATSPRRHAGPEALYVPAGRWEVRDPAGRAILDGERIILVDPRIPYALRNLGDGPASLLRLSLVPVGHPSVEDLPPGALDQ